MTSAGAKCSWQSKQYYWYFAIPKIQEYGIWYFTQIPDSHVPIAMALDKLQGKTTATLVCWCQPSNKRRRSCPLFLQLLNIVVLWLMGWSQVWQLIVSRIASRIPITVECLRHLSEPCLSTLECVNSFPTVKLLFRELNCTLPSSAPVKRFFSSHCAEETASMMTISNNYCYLTITVTLGQAQYLQQTFNSFKLQLNQHSSLHVCACCLRKLQY